jgi:hypothetical protein
MDEEDNQIATGTGLPQGAIDIFAAIVAFLHSPDSGPAIENLFHFFGNHAVLDLKLLDNLLQPNEAHDLHRRFSFLAAHIVPQANGSVNVWGGERNSRCSSSV